MALGGILNILFDPVLIFLLELGVTGAAIATMLSNVIAMTYFIFLLYKNTERTVIKFSLRNYSLQQGITVSVSSINPFTTGTAQTNSNTAPARATATLYIRIIFRRKND